MPPKKNPPSKPVSTKTGSTKTGSTKTASKKTAPKKTGTIPVVRIQTGVRMEKRLVKVLKGLAEYLDISMGDLLEGIVLHAFEGKGPFGEETLETIARLKEVYQLDLDASASHRLSEDDSVSRP